MACNSPGAFHYAGERCRWSAFLQSCGRWAGNSLSFVGGSARRAVAPVTVRLARPAERGEAGSSRRAGPRPRSSRGHHVKARSTMLGRRLRPGPRAPAARAPKPIEDREVPHAARAARHAPPDAVGLYALTTRGNVFVIFLRLKRGLTLSRVARAPVRCPLPTRAAPERCSGHRQRPDSSRSLRL